MITFYRPPATVDEWREAEARLEMWIRDRLEGGCRVISEGLKCKCALCDFERLTTPKKDH